MVAFASFTELGLRLNRTFSVGSESAWITSLLEDASTYLREDVLGLQVFPQSQSTFVAYPDAGRVDMPQSPVISIDSVVVGGITITDYTRRDNTIWLTGDDPATITFTYGYLVAPESLKRWCYVLTSQVLLTIEAQLGLTAGGLSSVAIDDFKAAFADAGDMSGITLSDRNIKMLRAQFGSRGSYVVTAR
jgi:hypothetical protein